ncbi:Ankyrin repeat domain-containing protein 17 [Fusarium austroafricanum]|uniref:Ankyrin repeat domain-containing protein 17 n=1 Tax=Fusarium austroafricanum TaxID=2364996 RepID=A0A8H4NWN2_9HYPO|nr:Ankyrin repeat domain-containing protein 17 [Fusarium austroafricanum]
MDNVLTGLSLIAGGTPSADPGVDIITIHGLGGYDSWKFPANQLAEDSDELFWVRDFLPTDQPSARIFTYNYRSSVLCDSEGIAKIAGKLLDKLKNLQKDNLECRKIDRDCLGGLVLQCALNTAYDSRGDKALDEIVRTTQGIIFLGAPHSSTLSGLQTSVARITAASKSAEVRKLASSHSTMESCSLLRRAAVTGYPVTSGRFRPGRIMDFTSGITAQTSSCKKSYFNVFDLCLTSHQDLCRFGTKEDVSYIKVLQSLRNIMTRSNWSAGDEIAHRSSAEDEVLESLQTEDVSTNVPNASQGTCSWILEHDAYKSWKSRSSQLLWITGAPGSGKSTMMKYLIEGNRVEHTLNPTVAYFFFSLHGTNQSVRSLLSSLLHQFLKTTPSTRSFEIFSKLLDRREHEGSYTKWDNDILTESLLSLVDKSTALGDSHFIFIDALDECDDTSMVVDLIQRLRRVNICVSCRPRKFSVPGAEIRMEENNSVDIERYLCNSLLALEDHLSPALDIEKVTRSLTEKAEGVFLWASLVVSHLRWDGYLQFAPFQKGFVHNWASLHSQVFKDQKLFEPRQTKGVHIMSYYGFPWYTQGIWGASLADINEEDHWGRTPLTLAAAMGNLESCVSLLLEGADMRYRDRVYGQTPLSVAAAHGHSEIVKLLLSKGSDYDDHVSGVSPLWLATRSGHLNVLKALLDAGANVNAASIHTGETPLFQAAALGHVGAVHLLIEKGAEVDACDNNGWTPLHHAVSKGRMKTIDVLLGLLESHQLPKLVDSCSKNNVKSSWVTTVLRAILLGECYQRRGGSQPPPAGSQSTQVSRTTGHSQALTQPGHNGHKHERDADKDEDGYRDGDKGNPKKKPRPSDQSALRFACPYFKKNAARRWPSGACNGMGFENIARLKESATDYENGYDQFQAPDLADKKPSNSSHSEEACWRDIFRLLFPDWRGDIPSPYQHEVIPPRCLQAAQQLRDGVMSQCTISQLSACQSEEGILRILMPHFGDIDSIFGLDLNATSSSLPGPMSVQQTLRIQNQRPQQYQAPPEQFFSVVSPSYNYASGISSSDANSSHPHLSFDYSGISTEETAFSDQMSTGIPLYDNMASSSSMQHVQQLPPVPQQSVDNMSHNLGSGFDVAGQGITTNNVWLGYPQDSQYHPESTTHNLGQSYPQSEGYDEEQNSSPTTFYMGK